MTAIAVRAGVWVRLNAWWAIEVYVSEEEIAAARRVNNQPDRSEERIANCIAIGKMCGAYPRQPGDVRARQD